MKKTLSVSAIEQGTVIDHIPAGHGLRILELLQLAQSLYHVTVGLNLPSKRIGHKDLIKIEDRFLSDAEGCKIALFAPQGTLSIIRNFQVEKKITAHLPPVIEGILICPNLQCITRVEIITTRFAVEHRKQGQFLFRCHFCEKVFPKERMQ